VKALEEIEEDSGPAGSRHARRSIPADAPGNSVSALQESRFLADLYLREPYRKIPFNGEVRECGLSFQFVGRRTASQSRRKLALLPGRWPLTAPRAVLRTWFRPPRQWRRAELFRGFGSPGGANQSQPTDGGQRRGDFQAIVGGGRRQQEVSGNVHVVATGAEIGTSRFRAGISFGRPTGSPAARTASVCAQCLVVCRSLAGQRLLGSAGLPDPLHPL
jgi:hypothetical protein